MLSLQEIKQKIEENLPGSKAEILDPRKDGKHLKAIITHPDFKGSINVEGVEYWVSAWKRKEDAHPKAPALSFSIQLKEQSGEASTGSQGNDTGNQGQSNDDPFSDNIGF